MVRREFACKWDSASSAIPLVSEDFLGSVNRAYFAGLRFGARNSMILKRRREVCLSVENPVTEMLMVKLVRSDSKSCLKRRESGRVSV